MKTNKLNKFSIPCQYNWICQQSYGSWMLSVKKPTIEDYQGNGSEFWYATGGKIMDLEIEKKTESFPKNKVFHWKKSLRAIKPKFIFELEN